MNEATVENVDRGRRAQARAEASALSRYVPRPGLSIPLVTILDPAGAVLEDEQRALVRFAVQEGAGAGIIFAVGTTGEWDRLDKRRGQLAARVTVEECRRLARGGTGVEAWVGITAHTRAETLDNLAHALEVGVDAAVIAPLSIADLDDPVTFVSRDIARLFEERGRALPIFLYDNADIAAPGKAPHLHTRDLKAMSALDYVRGIKVTASKTVLGNYTRAASHFKRRHEFPIYAGDPHVIFDLFAPPAGLGGRLRHYWNRYLTRDTLPYGIVSGQANAMPREWHRAWEVCAAGDGALMEHYARVLGELRDACVFARMGKPYLPWLACLKAALVELGVCASDAVAAGTPPLDEVERREFARRFGEIRRHASAILEPQWLSRAEAAPLGAQVEGDG